jgi:hypothetical protein
MVVDSRSAAEPVLGVFLIFDIPARASRRIDLSLKMRGCRAKRGHDDSFRYLEIGRGRAGDPAHAWKSAPADANVMDSA